ncbi:TRAP transporter small permease [Paralimibaculum aggregatum]|uniref:TRAP transporter small permease protein n=1 Tax=Paralimibaculum aggregatum TaxID=3036245 RepID=A0ABQ6LLN4_9RHOB|nr:TRAP transporter small permease [Limibaculum sp. NKW23]GMG83229.1 TRAP transporter small permease [Limibaculum sp. NKW23]
MSHALPTGTDKPRPETRLQRLVGALSTVSGVCSATMIAAAVLITCQMVVVRYVLNGSTIWQTEAVTYLMIAATLLGLPYVQRRRGHVQVDLIPEMLPRGARRVLAAITLALAVAMIGLMAWHSYDVWKLHFDRGWRSGTAWDVKLWVPYLAMPVGFGLYLLQLIADFAAEIAPPPEAR